MKIKNIMSPDRPKPTEKRDPDLLSTLLNRQLYPKDGTTLTVGEAIGADSLLMAQQVISDLNRDISLAPNGIVAKVLPRAASWNYQDLAKLYTDSDSLASLLETSQQEGAVIKQMIDNQGLNDPTPANLIASQWWATTISYETRAAIKRQTTAAGRKLAYQQAIAGAEIRQFRRTPDPEYGDVYNRLVCQRADQLGTTNLESVNQQISLEIANQVNDTKIINMLSTREATRQQQWLSKLLDIGLQESLSPEETIKFATIYYEIKRRQTDDIWGSRQLQAIIVNGLRGGNINFITMLCTINEFDYQGGYTLNPSLDTYKTNLKVEPVPLIVDEMADFIFLFKYYGFNCQLTMYVADTDYTEIGANGPITRQNMLNLQLYLKNLQRYVTKFDGCVSVTPISSLTDGNPAYLTTKQRVLGWVTARKDVDFNGKWGNKWEEDVERRNETFGKKKLCLPNQVRQQSLRVAQNIWAVNAAQGAVFSNLDLSTVLISSERRARDMNYVVDEQATANFPPVVYVLKVAEDWNRKVVNKAIFQSDDVTI
jgi:hypothetical protein